MPRLPLVGPESALLSPGVAASECINYYPEAIESPPDQVKNAAILRGVPGYEFLSNLGIGSIRGLWSCASPSGGGRLFVVRSNTIHEVDSDGISVSDHVLPTPNVDNGPVQIFPNAAGTMIAIIANGYVHYWTGAAGSGVTLATFSGGATPVPALSGAVLGNALYVHAPWGGTPDEGRRVYFSAPNDFTSWDALDYKDKEGASDYIQRLVSDKGQLYVFGATDESEVWQLDPSTGLPIVIPGASMRQALAARWSPSLLSESLFFLGGGPRGGTVAYQMRGFSPIPISTPAIEAEWSGIATFAEQAISFAYISKTGHPFWVVNYSTGRLTYVYDVRESARLGFPCWHTRARWNALAGAWNQSRAWHHTFIPEWGASGMHIVGGGETFGKLYEMSDDCYTDDGDAIKSVRAIPYRYVGGRRVYFGRQDIGAEGPAISREFSDDNGATWSAGETECGNGTTRRYWPVGGSCESNGRIWRYTQSGQTKRTLIDLQGEEDAGAV